MMLFLRRGGTKTIYGVLYIVMYEDLLKQGIAALQAGHRAEARKLLIRYYLCIRLIIAATCRSSSNGPKHSISTISRHEGGDRRSQFSRFALLFQPLPVLI
jgi:hypothetical protein